ncbi:MAG: hypothetical protein KY456_01075 [Chloroflexi bacterium]|nr:hypothetical protein [Chloroflexota bacterium]
MDWPEILSSATVAILAVWLGATVFSRAPADRAARLFSLLALLLACWAGARALEPFADREAAPFLQHLRNASAYLLPPLLAHLVAVFTSSRIRGSRLLIIGIGYAAAVPLAVRAFTDPARPFHVDAPHFSLPWIGGEVFGWAWIALRLAVLAAAAWWAWRYVAEVRADPSRIRQATAVLAAVLLGAVGATLLILPTLARPPLWFSVSLVGLALVCATYAVVAQRVFLAPEVARQAVSSTLAGGLAVTALVGALFALEAVADEALGLGLPIVTAVVLALSLAVYDPVRLAWRRLTKGRDRARAESALPMGVGPDRLAAQHADDSIAPALDRLVWRFGLSGARALAGDGRVIAEAGSLEGPAVVLPLAAGAEQWGQLLIGAKQSGLPFGKAETLVLEQTAEYVAAALHLGERQRQHAAERAALVAEREAQDAKANVLAAAVETDAAPALRIYALGPLRAELGDAQIVQWGGRKAGSRQAEAMFAFLFDRGQRGVAKDEFLDLIWPDVPFDRADVAFHRTMNGLRRTLAPAGATIAFFNDRYHLTLNAATWSDVAAFTASLAQASDASSSSQVLPSLLQARVLYRGDYLDDCPFYGDSADVEERRTQLRQRFVDLLVALGTQYEMAGDRPAAADAFRQAVAVSTDDCPPATEGLARLRASA